jgi:nucleoid-associated protein YgaU
MSVMSAAEAGQPSGASPEIFSRGPRMARSATDHDGAGQDAGSPGAGSWSDRCAEAEPPAPAPGERRLRLVATEVRVRQVRVAREVSTQTLRAGGPQMSAQRVSAHRVSAERVSVERASARRVAAQPGGLRLTRRGRRVVTGSVMLLIVVVAMLVWTGVAGGAQAPGPGASPGSAYQGMTQIVVQPGQTLWSIAVAAEPSANPWTVLQQITDANALSGTHVQAGQLLWVPKG